MKKLAAVLMVVTSLLYCSCGKSKVSMAPGGGVMLDLVLIRPGKFLMGSEYSYDEEGPVHEVRISQPFYLGKYEVTQAQWQAVMGWNPSECKGATLPVECVSWDDCQEFIEKLNSKGIGTFRLPTEAEWEYACRAGTTDDFAKNLDEIAWYNENSGDTTHPVGTKKANPWGLYDMHGNVSEFCLDWWYAPYNQGKQTDPIGLSWSFWFVCRGGSYLSSSKRCLSASRSTLAPWCRRGYQGFRLVMMVQ
ncbi:formylglycine-generating enzyme family protein [Oligosphaera ethanolica]|uniref:Formylglycine-generating enzyme required for sulfatase activity n=1 Tax=Oligosphaera ethanolica TaxID=760260 RepID=A0AAE3VKQ9_9BACT|nr:formylglycine-generating enzyme family protein [Oligosphaera ethanolica]MDQ0291904.1 formylglycine-generating enzyme required for sulfatase activity [Oligosphaera ethanolica]